MSDLKKYSYFDTPEGEDILKKVWCVLKPAGLTGIALSTVDVMCYPYPRSYLQIVGRYAYITLPIIGMTAAFVITTNLALNVRKQDDKLNWVAGSLAAGSVFGAWRRSTVAGLAASAAFSFGAIIKKHAVQEGWSLIPENPKVAYGGLHAPRYDWTLTKDRPRNWTTVAPSAEQ